jgi:glutamate N-acetyltransferase/amino-acid N-acetyltransferase
MLPKGFLFSAAEAAIKKPGRKDLGLIYSQVEANMAGVFTTNNVKAAPVVLGMRRIRSGKGRAIIVNSGNANACTGKQGMADALLMTKLVARGAGISPSSVYACSTGVIGTPMPMDRIQAKIPELVRALGRSSLDDIAQAIMTTDTFPKIVRKKVKLGSRTGNIAAICKGAGMICPDMATMLCFVVTDIAVSRKALEKALREAVKLSFNRLTVDGDMSTNDTVLLMANGFIGNTEITEKSGTFEGFRRALFNALYELSIMIARDGEGATKLIEVTVKGAKSEQDAERAAFAVANSNLVKTAVYGNDANWGRIMAALGYSGAGIREERVDISFGKVRVVHQGLTTGKDAEAANVLKEKQVGIVIDLHIGKASARVLTCDMTEEYIRVNADYRT